MPPFPPEPYRALSPVTPEYEPWVEEQESEKEYPGLSAADEWLSRATVVEAAVHKIVEYAGTCKAAIAAKREVVVSDTGDAEVTMARLQTADWTVTDCNHAADHATSAYTSLQLVVGSLHGADHDGAGGGGFRESLYISRLHRLREALLGIKIAVSDFDTACNHARRAGSESFERLKDYRRFEYFGLQGAQALLDQYRAAEELHMECKKDVHIAADACNSWGTMVNATAVELARLFGRV